jgi:flagellar basal body-associated protein FliL
MAKRLLIVLIILAVCLLGGIAYGVTVWMTQTEAARHCAASHDDVHMYYVLIGGQPYPEFYHVTVCDRWTT